MEPFGSLVPSMDKWAAMPSSQNIDDRRDQWLRGIIGQYVPSTLFSAEDWKRMVLNPMTPLPGFGGVIGEYPYKGPSGPLSGAAGYYDIPPFGSLTPPTK